MNLDLQLYNKIKHLETHAIDRVHNSFHLLYNNMIHYID